MNLSIFHCLYIGWKEIKDVPFNLKVWINDFQYPDLDYKCMFTYDKLCIKDMLSS